MFRKGDSLARAVTNRERQTRIVPEDLKVSRVTRHCDPLIHCWRRSRVCWAYVEIDEQTNVRPLPPLLVYVPLLDVGEKCHEQRRTSISTSRIPISARQMIIVNASKFTSCQNDLLEIVLTLCARGGLADPLDSRQEQG
jgi:hypothetical protein